ncbi:hypothetical protein [Paenibacillus pini]|nr:hypothetical protein [Paenibacillus pini]
MDAVLLVDDESGAIDAIKYALDWEQYGFAITGEALMEDRHSSS